MKEHRVNPMNNDRIRTKLARFALVATVGLAASGFGCKASVPPYHANQNVVKQLGEDAAKEKLKKLLAHATAPQVQAGTVEVDSEFYHYQALDIAMFGRGFVSMKVRFKEVEHAEVWEKNGSWYVKLVGSDKLDQLKWNSKGDATEFADLIMSFKARG